MKGTLYLLPCTLGDTDTNWQIPQLVARIVDQVDHYIVEDLRTARRFLRSININKPIESLNFGELNEHTPDKEVHDLLAPLHNGYPVALMSDAGCPGVADPGAKVVAIAHQQGITVKPLTGPSSIIMAMMGSGLNGQNFAFNGYLPIKPTERATKLKMLESRSATEGQTQLFIEAPYRNRQMLETILSACSPATLLTIACDLTLPTELVKTYPLSYWKTNIPDLDKRPTVFALHKMGNTKR